MKTCRNLVVLLSATLLLAGSAVAQNLFVAAYSSDSILELVSNNGVLSTNPTLFASGLNGPVALAFDSLGDLFEADWTGEKIYEFPNTDGILSTNPTVFASGLGGPLALVFDSAGDLFEADAHSNRIYKFISHDGVLTTRALMPSALNFS